MKTPNSEARTVTVALAGQPNVGKSTVFNLLTGLSQHVGNWPGKTIEQKVGMYHHQRNGELCAMRIVDLPGTYSLTANSLEEQIARDYIIKERPDAVAVIADAAALERNLYLLAEFLFLPVPLVLGLNMTDVAERQDIHISPRILEAALGVPVVPMVATKNQGVRELVEAVDRVIRGATAYVPSRPAIREDHRAVLEEIRALIAGQVPEPYPEEWVALKLLEGDGEVAHMMQERMREDWAPVCGVLTRHEDAFLAVASGRYEWIGRIARAAMTRPRTGQITLTDRLDRVATHPFWGLLVLLGMLGVVFWLTYSIAAPLQGLLDEYLVRAGRNWLHDALAGAPWWVVGALADGAIAGAGMVITFLPILIVFFAVLGLLEDVGYMARAAFVMDRFMHFIGLHGRSFLPLFLGFGCNVPAVLGTRIIDAPRARLLTILLAPLVPCTARMAVVAILAPVFFGGAAFWVSWGLVGLNLVVLAVLGVVLRRPVLGRESLVFVMEIPLYHRPNARTIGLAVWQRTLAFLKKAGGIILVFSVVVWALSALPAGEMDTSYLATIGRALAPLGAWMGLEWQMLVALLSSFVAKENTIATLAILYRAGGEESSLAGALAGAWTPAAGLAFLVVQMLFIPCAATAAVIRQETGSWAWTVFSVALLAAISLAAGVSIFQGATLFGLGG
ncbi:MAG: ferrous iron transport protein B [Zetaproteobacteria bacterium]|nr:MAG: ferrous iron transport protein B [Zetaproteobacteria bacterium]